MKRNDIEIEKLQNEIIKAIKIKIDEIKEQSEKNMRICHKLIYLMQTKFIGNLKNKNLIAELKSKTFYLNKGTTYSVIPCSYSFIVSAIKVGKIDGEQIELLYNAIKNYEEIEENIKKYGGTKK